ncbi:MAG TPA: GDSL-type esterase/lipase family protein [Tepidisphaeraceae bacterium]|jgi:lysophospholipase L1-like esterase|nr:GDSL-type esterase/lipase family protein [Tepidisphaeraceae bacterium]
MPWYIYSLARGSVFFWGCCALLISSALLTPKAGRAMRPKRRIYLVIATTMAIALIVISAAPLPLWFYGVWAVTALAWLATPLFKRRFVIVAVDLMLSFMTALAAYVEFTHTVRPVPPAGSFSRLYVVGDSISAGLGQEHGKTWPVLIAAEHHVNIVDLSHAGATIAEATRRVEGTKLADGLVILEIGGNDMLGHAKPERFAEDLELLAEKVEGPARRLVMLELPLLPFDNAYGLVQRRIAARHHITLIPRRFFVDVLQAPGATVDGIHLSAGGQRLLAKMIWSFIAPSIKPAW